MKLLEIFKSLKDNITKELSAVYYAYQDPQTGLLPKILILLALGYALSPIDLIPDFIPVLGYLDDLLLVPLLLSLSIHFIPAEVMGKCRQRAEKEPMHFKKRWIVGLLVIMVWILMIVWCVWLVYYLTGLFL